MPRRIRASSIDSGNFRATSDLLKSGTQSVPMLKAMADNCQNPSTLAPPDLDCNGSFFAVAMAQMRSLRYKKARPHMRPGFLFVKKSLTRRPDRIRDPW
jgi:hypothetical protein